MLIKKYDQQIPGYPGYPDSPLWHDELNMELWKQDFQQYFNAENYKTGISIYIHLPFFDSLGTYSELNNKIITNQRAEEEYITALEQEWKLYRKMMQQTPIIKALHLAGGAASFFSPKNLGRLLNLILSKSIVHPDHEFSIEGHSNKPTIEHLRALYSFGFRRISYDLQDNDTSLQKIHANQKFEKVRAAIENARNAGFSSVNIDLLYDLPLQTVESLERMMYQVIGLKPDRIAFAGNACLFSGGESNLPTAEEKIKLYLKGKDLLLSNHYVEIGMDLFALPGDELAKAKEQGQLFRNFMGYTTRHTGLLLGLGVSGISQTPGAFAQNEKSLNDYYTAIKQGKLAVKNGYILNTEDIEFHKYISDISCQAATVFNEKHLSLLQQYTFPQLKVFEEDGLIEWNEKGLNIKPRGNYFLRNICSAFDLKFIRQMALYKQIFSTSI
jgi:oxygen-independent coproporphyrinogen III oxidase